MDTTVIQIGVVESIIWIAVTILTLGIAWGTLRSDVKHLERDVEKLEPKLDKKIDNFIARIESLLWPKSGLSVQNSPQVPSEGSKKLLEDSHWSEVYQNLKNDIFAYIDNKNPKILYDIEQEAYNALISLRGRREMDPMKNFLVHNPSSPPLSVILLIASWIVRDDYERSKKI